MNSDRRKSSYIPRSVQRSLFWRAVWHWSFLLKGTLGILLVWQHMIGEPYQTIPERFAETWDRFAPCFVILMIVLPVVIYDTVKFSNRVAGPLYRLRRALESLANREPVAPIRFRKGDFCQDLAEYFNTALARIQHEEGIHSTSEESEYETVGSGK